MNDCDNIRDGFQIVDKIGYFLQEYTGNFEKDRKTIRDELVKLFQAENVGKGKGSLSTRVIYCVEKIDNEIIYLKRPAPLNKGFDFEIHTKSKIFGGRIKSRPRHQDILNNLNQLKMLDKMMFTSVQKIVDEIYLCNDKNIDSINFQFNNLNVTILLKLIKWLFLEQDITYWSFSGREMFYKALKNV